jgi:hypothetical protein
VILKVLLIIAAVPACCGLTFLFLRLRFGLIKDEAEKLEKMRKWFGD